MPEEVKPPGALETGAKKAGRRKHAWISKHVRNDDQCCKKIAACES